jgi:hypothetical protein
VRYSAQCWKRGTHSFAGSSKYKEKKMISLDPYITEFVSGNMLTITIALGLLKAIAAESKNNIDNKISTYLNNVVASILPGKK